MKKIIKPGAFALLLLLGACIDFDLYDPEDYEYDEEHCNEVDPNSNHLINNESFYGKHNLKSSIHDLLPTSNGHFYFYGFYDDSYVAGKITLQGDMIWVKELSYIAKAIRIHQNRLLICGSQDKNGKGVTDIGILELIDRNGNQLLRSTWNDFDHIRFNGFNEKYIVGRCREGNSIHPFIAEYYVDDLDTIFHGAVKSFPELENQYFHKIEKNYILGAKFRGDFTETEAYEIMLHCLNEKTFKLDWSTSIIAETGFETSEGDLLTVDSLIYVSGNSEVYEYDPPYNQDYWTDGLLASLNTDGSINFVETYNASIRGDKYTGLIYDQGIVFAYGRTSSYWLVLTNDSFSYGLISSFDPVNGALLSHYLFGSNSYASSINILKKTNIGFVFAGHSKQEYYDYEHETAYQAWFVNVSDLFNPVKTRRVTLKAEPDQKIKGGDPMSSAPNRQ
ncbi:MAG: hypothetical protein K9G67_08130 [Bacteroidales bacterium]|nr:hypothetical protein [Bacteroidales bacterium]MCF8344711.1 hypothetical protein [Bacteroidales bacterium]MCF8376306.1 hypothetical protein [Bacteroidales bacterium]MCF8400999.1 hypothetical protein [Bacteroidales bacterium]